MVYKEPRGVSPPDVEVYGPFVVKKRVRGKPPTLPKLVGSSFACTGGSFAPDLVEARLYRSAFTTSRSLTREGTPVKDFGGTHPGVQSPPSLELFSATLPGNYRCQIIGTNIAGSTVVTSPPVAIFKTGKLKRNLKRGTAKLTVELPAEAGTLTLATKGFKAVSRSASGKTAVLLKPKGAKKAKLASTGKLKAIAKLTYTPPGGAAAMLRTRVTLKQR